VYKQYQNMYDLTKVYYRLSGLLGEGRGDMRQVTCCRKRLLNIKIDVDRAVAGTSRSNPWLPTSPNSCFFFTFLLWFFL